MMNDDKQEKTCAKCKKVKSLSEFHRNIYISDGYASYCKECHKETVAKVSDNTADVILKRKTNVVILQYINADGQLEKEEVLHIDLLKQLHLSMKILTI